MPLLASLPLEPMGYAALACARLVEHGASPESAPPILIARLKDCLPLAGAYVSACERAGIDVHEPPSDMPATEESAAWNALGWICAALEIILSHTLTERLAARADQVLRAAVDEFPHGHPGPLRLHALLDVLDDEELLVLHPAEGRGYRVWVSGIATGRQLHTLLADTLIGDPALGMLPGTRPDPRVVALARGQPARPIDTRGLGAQPDVCLLNLLSWYHLRPDGALPPGKVALLWPSSTLAEIEPFEGRRVVLLGPPAMQLAWSTVREFQHMAAEARLVEILDPATVHAWLHRIAAAPR